MGMHFDEQAIQKAVGPCDFILGNIDNIYRTKDYIIAQQIVISEFKGETQLISLDSFYRRTQLRDMQYERIFAHKGDKLEGRRLVSNINLRKVFN